MVGTVTKAPIAFYYDSGELDRLSDYQRVVLQPDHYSPADLRRLRQRGVQPLAYLSLSEDTGPPAPWHIDLYALDYADDEGLAEFATPRARQFGLHSFISNRALSRI